MALSLIIALTLTLALTVTLGAPRCGEPCCRSVTCAIAPEMAGWHCENCAIDAAKESVIDDGLRSIYTAETSIRWP